ncbi:MAG: hypothetical protein AAFQ80_16220 [Cyanobacteria bacterium J06621_8]
MSDLNQAKLEDNEILIPFAEILEQLVYYGEPLEDPTGDRTMKIEQVTVKMPVEIKVTVDEDGQASLISNAPTQSTETTTIPVFYRLKLTVELDN